MRKLNTGGFTHVVVLALTLVGVAIIGTFMVVASNAAAPAKHKKTNTRPASTKSVSVKHVKASLKPVAKLKATAAAVSIINQNDQHLMAAAAQNYWQRTDSANYNSASCTPYDIQIHYFNSKSSPYIAKEYVGNAFLSYRNKYYHGYCEMDFNKYYVARDSKALLCLTFVHEYGHALGYHHSTNPNNVMYPTADGNQLSNPLLLNSGTECPILFGSQGG